MHSHFFDVNRQWSQNNPGLDTSSMKIVGLVKLISWAMEGAVAPLYEGAPLTASELDLLLPLRYSPGPVIARRLAEDMNVSPAAVSKALARLEKRGHIARECSPANRRAALVFITEQGKAAVDKLFPRQMGVESALLAGLGVDRERVLEALQVLLEVVERKV